VAAYNEENVIADTINELISNWYKNIIVINDGSKDKTLDILNKYSDKIIILNHYKNRGQWAALETGFEYIRRYSNNKFIATFDADWQHNLSDLDNFLNILRNDEEVEIVLWSRFITKTNTNVSLSRKIILKLGIIFTFLISNISLTDAHNGYRVFRKNVLNKMQITIDGMWHASEIVDIIATKKISFMEVPVNIKYTAYSMSKWQKSSNAINIALKMIWTKFFK
jgi:glycosyltransferase involved in cell wall biosynthesis